MQQDSDESTKHDTLGYVAEYHRNSEDEDNQRCDLGGDPVWALRVINTFCMQEQSECKCHERSSRRPGTEFRNQQPTCATQRGDKHKRA